METLVVVPQHQNQYYSRNSSQIHERFGSPTGGFKDINCRFQAREGILSTPLKSCNISSVTKNAPLSPTQEPFTPVNEERKHSKNNGKSNAIPIVPKANNIEKSFSDDLSFSELWAGPAYSNSPPPSSLPMPKFFLRPKRSVSVELPVMDYGLKIHPIAKSAPSSPRREPLSSPNNSFRNTASATKDLRRILHLDLDDE